MRLLAFISILLLPLSLGAGLQASFTGSRICDMGDQYNIFEYCSNIGGYGSDQFIDEGGENLLLNSADASLTWIPTRSSVVTNQYKNPIDGSWTMDVFHEDGTAASTHYLSQTLAGLSTTSDYTLSFYMKALNRFWVDLEVNDGATHYSFFNLSTGANGTQSGLSNLGHTGSENRCQKIIGDIYRCNIRWSNISATPIIYILVSGADNVYLLDGLDQNSIAIFGWQLVRNDSWLQGPGKYIATGSVNKPRLDLAPTGSPPSIETDLQGADGNKLMGRYFDQVVPQRYTRADSDCVDVFDSDHTLTAVVNFMDATGDPTIFGKGVYDTSGMACQLVGGTSLECYYSKVGADVSPHQALTADNKYHVIQVVRSNNLATVYIDGSAGASVDVTGYGLDNATDFSIGAWVTLNRMRGSILYSKLQSRALSTTELARDREQIWGILSNHSKRTPFTFARTTSAFKSLSTGGIANTAVNVPRVSGDGGGVLVEGQSENSYQYSEDRIGQMSQFSTGTIAFGVNDLMAPDGTMTAESVSDTNEAGPLFYTIGQNATNPVTTATVYTVSFHVKKLPTATAVANDINVRLLNGAHDSENHFNPVTGQWGAAIGTALIARNVESTGDGWLRFSQTLTALSTANLTVVLYLNGGASYTATGVAQIGIWGSQTEPLSFMSSYIPNLAASSTVRTADNMTLDPHSGTDIILPETFGPSPNPASKLTIEFQAKMHRSTYVTPYETILSIPGSGFENNLTFFTGDGFVWMYLNDGVTILWIRGNGTPVIDSTQWNHFKGFIDFSDLSRSKFYINGVLQTASTSPTGSSTWSTVNNLIHVGDAGPWGQPFHGSIKDLRMEAAEF